MSTLRSRVARLEASQPSASLVEARAFLADLGSALGGALALIDGQASDHVPGPALVRAARSRTAGDSLLGRLAQALTTERRES